MTAKDRDIPIQYLDDCFALDAENGVLIWKRRPREHFASLRACSTWNTRFAGGFAGTPHSEGHLSVAVTIDGRHRILKVHRVVWALGMDAGQSMRSAIARASRQGTVLAICAKRRTLKINKTARPIETIPAHTPACLARGRASGKRRSRPTAARFISVVSTRRKRPSWLTAKRRQLSSVHARAA